MNLRNRLYQSILEQHNYDKRKALQYVNKKCMHYARKSDSCRQDPLLNHLAERWHKVYKAYSSVQFALGYYLSLDEEMIDD